MAETTRAELWERTATSWLVRSSLDTLRTDSGLQLGLEGPGLLQVDEESGQAGGGHQERRGPGLLDCGDQGRAAGRAGQ